MDKTLFLQLFIVLLLAHLLGDFVCQSDSFIKNKDKWFWRILHSIIHALLVYLLLGKWTLWLIPVVIGVTHYLIDWGKNLFKHKGIAIFSIDQGLHLLVLGGMTSAICLWGISAPSWINWLSPFTWNIAVLICAVILLIPCGGIFIGLFMGPLQQQIGTPSKGLKDGGKLIGYLERLLILVFVIVNQFAGIGFLVAAKSIFRFSEIKENNDRKEAEYIIIGTFASFLYAIIISWVTSKIIIK
jgi:hypothetical protein